MLQITVDGHVTQHGLKRAETNFIHQKNKLWT